MTSDQKEQILKITGWKIHSKQGKRKFWESPHDGKVYPTTLALIAQQVAEGERLEAERAKRAAEMQPGPDYDKWDNWEIDIDEVWPPPTKEEVREYKKSKRKSKKKGKVDVGKNIHELGY